MPNSPTEISETSEPKDNEKAALIAELRQAGIKHTPDQIVGIAKLPEGKIVFIETGDENSGLQHIVNNHTSQFVKKGISEYEIADAVIMAVTYGTIIGYQQPDRPIYEISFKGKTQIIAVTVSKNGYIVCANPRSTRR